MIRDILDRLMEAAVSNDEIRRKEANWAIKPLRDAVMAKTGGRCFYCGCDAKAVDHFLPVTKGGPDTEGNLVPACSSCNNSKKHYTLEEWRGIKRRAMAVANGAPNFYAGQYKWLLSHGFDVFDVIKVDVPTFWFEDEGIQAPDVSAAAWVPSERGIEWAKNRARKAIEREWEAAFGPSEGKQPEGAA